MVHLLLLTTFLASCEILDVDPTPPFRGLATAEMILTPEALHTLNIHRNVNVFVSGDFLYDFPEKGIRKDWLVGVRNAGQFSRKYFKRNFRLRFPADSLFYGKAAVNLSSQPSDETALRSFVGYSVLRAAGFHVPEVQPVALYLNNVYQGLHVLIEPIDKSFFDRRAIPIRSLFEAQQLEARWSYGNGFNVRLGYAKVYPDDDNFSELERLIGIITSATPESIEEQLAGVFDLEGYSTYQAAMIVIQNFDSWNNNFHLYHDERTGTLRIQPWDVDHAYDTELGIFAPTPLNDLIVANPVLRTRYLRKILELLDGPANPAVLLPAIQERILLLAEAYDSDPYCRSAGWTMQGKAVVLEQQILASSQRLRDEAEHLLQERF